MRGSKLSAGRISPDTACSPRRVKDSEGPAVQTSAALVAHVNKQTGRALHFNTLSITGEQHLSHLTVIDCSIRVCR